MKEIGIGLLGFGTVGAGVVEGVATTRSVNQLARRHAVDMPITAAVHGILFESLDPRDAIRALMEREQKAERIG